jgi:hypothetical protein
MGCPAPETAGVLDQIVVDQSVLKSLSKEIAPLKEMVGGLVPWPHYEESF